MTDITELAQSLKAAAEKATPGRWERGDGKHGGELLVYCDDALGSAVCEATSEYNAIPKYQRIDNLDFIAMANPANVLALVAALERSQRANAAQDDHINQQQDRIDQLEKGHQEAAKQINSWRRMAKQNIAEREKDIAELDAARQRISELESRTVKLPELCVGVVQGGHAVMAPYPAGHWFNKTAILEMLAAAGIKVEAE
ncbi:TPA: ead/Ea22-like family protein [Klebsiella pneumoniae]|nr:ead/Ea22-like family protein [Klebsiella pneumoniae]